MEVIVMTLPTVLTDPSLLRTSPAVLWLHWTNAAKTTTDTIPTCRAFI